MTKKELVEMFEDFADFHKVEIHNKYSDLSGLVEPLKYNFNTNLIEDSCGYRFLHYEDSCDDLIDEIIDHSLNNKELLYLMLDINNSY